MADTNQILRLAAIIREVDGTHSKGAAALAESILDHPRFRAVLAGGPAVPIPPAALPEGYIDPEHSGVDRALLQTFYSACQAEGGTADEVTLQGLRAVLAHWGNHVPAPPADGEVAELVAWLREQLHVCLQAPWTPGIKHFGRAAELLERQAPVPVSVSDALIKAECALSDIAEGEPMTDEGDPLKWAERRCADTLAVIRPTMMQHKIRTSEWPPVAAHALPLPEVGE